MVVVEVPGGGANLQRELPILTEFPVVEAASHSSDGIYPTLQWQPRAARIAIFRIIAATDWLKVKPPKFLLTYSLSIRACIPIEGDMHFQTILYSQSITFALSLNESNSKEQICRN